MVDLHQEASSCDLTASVGWYEFQGKDVLPSMTDILKRGMVPVVSYWKSDDMLWLDGNDVNGETPCQADRPLDCPLVGPKVLNIQVSDFDGFIHESTMNIKPTTQPAYGAGVMSGVGDDGAEAYGAGTVDEGVPSALATAGWTTVLNGGETYYYNTLTHQTAWSLPA